MIIDPSIIEKELSELLMKSSPTEARASLLNLVVFSARDRQDQANSLLDAVLGKRAARVIHVVQSDKADSSVSVSARCYLDHRRRSVCLQEVIIENGRDGIGADPSSWAPLLIRDIPVYSVWLDRIVDNGKQLDRIVDIADTLIVDSEASLRTGESLRELFPAIAGMVAAESIAISDMTWHRVLPLCAITAECFDSPLLLEKLDEIESVTLSGGPVAFGMFFLGWFAGRVGWRKAIPRGIDPAGQSPDRIWEMKSPHGRAVAVRHEKRAPIDQGAEVTVRFADETRLRIRTAAGGCAEVDAEGEETLQVMRRPDDGDILLAEIDGMRRDHIYAQTVQSLDNFT